MIARTRLKSWKYVLVEDRTKPRDQQVVHLLGALTVDQQANTLDGLEPDDKGDMYRKNLGSSYMRSFRAGYRGCENLKDGGGKLIPYEADKNGVVTDDFADNFTIWQRHEIARAIEQQIKWDPDEVGKSAPASASDTATSVNAAPSV